MESRAPKTTVTPFSFFERHQDFLSNEQIQQYGQLIEICSPPYQENIIYQVLQKYHLDNSFIIPSYNGYRLIGKLESDDLTLEVKWKALSTYIAKQSRDVYANNGKKLFNIIVNVFEDKKKDPYFCCINALREAVKQKNAARFRKILAGYPGRDNVEVFADEIIGLLNYAISCQAITIAEYLADTYKSFLDAKNLQVVPQLTRK